MRNFYTEIRNEKSEGHKSGRLLQFDIFRKDKNEYGSDVSLQCAAVSLSMYGGEPTLTLGLYSAVENHPPKLENSYTFDLVTSEILHSRSSKELEDRIAELEADLSEANENIDILERKLSDLES